MLSTAQLLIITVSRCATARVPAFVKLPDHRVIMTTLTITPLLAVFLAFAIVFAPLGFFVVVSHGIWTLNCKFADFQRRIYNNAIIDHQHGIKSYEFKPRKLIGFNY